jgi:HemY protein
MRRIFVYSLIGLLLGVGAVTLIEIDPGYVLVAYGNYTIETSLWVGSLLLIVFTLLVYITVRLVRKLLAGKNSVSGWLGLRKSRKGVHLSNRGLINFIEGNWSKSRRQLLSGAKAGEAPLLNYLIAARASYQLNDVDGMRTYLGAAEDAESDAGVAVEITQAELKLGAGQYEEALAALVRARKNAGRHPQVLNLLQQAFIGVGDWKSLAELLPELKKHSVMQESDLLELEKTAHTHLFAQSLQAKDAPAIHKNWSALPQGLKSDPELMHSYLSALIKLGEHEEAGKLIIKHLKQRWDSKLVRLYGLLESANSSKQLAKAESWLADHSADAQLQLSLGRLSARNNLWGKARDYFENSYKLDRSTEICAELGRLLASLGEPKVSAAYFREGLLLTESGLPELPMPDKAVSRAGNRASS